MRRLSIAQVRIDGGRTIAVYNSAPAERALLASGMNSNAFNEEVSAHVKDEIHRVLALEITDKRYCLDPDSPDTSVIAAFLRAM